MADRMGELFRLDNIEAPGTDALQAYAAQRDFDRQAQPPEPFNAPEPFALQYKTPEFSLRHFNAKKPLARSQLGAQYTLPVPGLGGELTGSATFQGTDRRPEFMLRYQKEF